ncbi:MAG: hypothetical protein VR70_06635 [Rhodospirillaceae bacterium BRH_c57]|nr:MAG: hypothetical protein VR70_06635 [Rhodospirillaceae bacterium BRH_c57]
MIINNSSVYVLLSSYNGMEYIEEQIDSIICQSGDGIHLIIRDDGSSDGTREVLDRLSARETGRLTLLPEARLGVIGSFFHLLFQTPDDAAFVAFADQDDVWLPGKVARARLALEEQVPQGRPALYCSRLKYVDADLAPLGLSPLPRRPLCLANALVENVAAGCTIMLNRAAVDLLRSVPPPAAVQMHDWWFYIVVSAFGTVIFDPEPSLLYRQHGNNVVGAGRNPLARLARKVRGQLTRPPGLCRRQAVALRQAYGDAMGPAARDILGRFLDASEGRGTPSYVLGQDRVFRQAPLDDLALRGLMLLGRI